MIVTFPALLASLDVVYLKTVFNMYLDLVIQKVQNDSIILVHKTQSTSNHQHASEKSTTKEKSPSGKTHKSI